MKLSTINTERALIKIASSMGRTPRSWSGWKILFISFEHMELHLRSHCVIWAKSIVESYLSNVKGQVFFCESTGIHILCNNVDDNILTQAGQQICELIEYEDQQITEFSVFDLEVDVIEYTQSILAKIPDLFALPNNLSIDQSTRSNLPEDNLVTKRAPDTASKKVLLVEDDPVTRWMVRKIFMDNCDLATAATASKVFSLYPSFQPDIVFLDIELPDQTGMEVLDWILRNDTGAEVIMFSSNNSLENMLSTLERGAKGFISKPFLKEDLMEYVHNQTNDIKITETVQN